MNDNDLKNSSTSNNVYKATTNLNTALENPQVNINSAVGVNIQGIDNSYNLDQNRGYILPASDLNGLEYNQNLVNNMDMQKSGVGNLSGTPSFIGQAVSNTGNISNINTSSVFYNTVNGSLDNITNKTNNVQTQFSGDVNNASEMQFVSGASLVNGGDFTGVANIEGYEQINNNNSNNINYEPTIAQKKKPSEGLAVAKEVKAMALIIFILLIFIFVIPYIYDFFRELDLVITN